MNNIPERESKIEMKRQKIPWDELQEITLEGIKKLERIPVDQLDPQKLGLRECEMHYFMFSSDQKFQVLISGKKAYLVEEIYEAIEGLIELRENLTA